MPNIKTASFFHIATLHAIKAKAKPAKKYIVHARVLKTKKDEVHKNF